MFEISLLPKQADIFNDDHRFKIVAAGRRFGKTQLAAYTLALHALQEKDSIGWIVSPTFPQSMIMWRMIKKIIKNKDLAKYVKSIKEGEKYIELANGSTIWAKSGDLPDNLRGEGLTYVVLDEAAMIKEEVWFNVVRPALADKKGKAILISTPKGKNWFYQMFLRGLDDPDYKSFQFTSYENTTIPEEEWVGITKELPELIYRQEIMAEFIEGGGVVFRNVENVLTSELKDAQAGVSYIMGVDLAKYEDFTVISVAEVDTRKLVYLHRFNQIDWNYQKDYIKQISQQYNGCICYIDSTGLGDPVAEDLMKNNVPIVPVRITSLSKSQLIQNLQLMIENKQIELLNDPELRKEFGAFAYELSPSGNLRYGAPSGFHDDIVISIALLAFGLGGLGGATCVGFYTPMPGEKDSESVWNEEE